jgi:uncharacterized protein YbcI
LRGPLLGGRLETGAFVPNASPPAVGQTAGEVTTALVGLFREYTGRGPTKARTTLADDSVLVVLQDTMTQEERMLVVKGKCDTVLDTRRQVQEILRQDAIEIVERITARKVVAFMSSNHVDPDLAAEVFVLEPLP